MFPIALGAEIYYAESLEKLAANIEEVQPTIMVVVPRLFEMLRARIIKSIEASGGLSKYLLARALKIGADKAAGKLQAVGLADGRPAVADPAAQGPRQDRRRQKAWVSGGAPLNPEVGMFFESLGITFLQGYGQTEAGRSSAATGRAPASGSIRSARRSRIPKCGSPRTARSWSAERM